MASWSSRLLQSPPPPAEAGKWSSALLGSKTVPRPGRPESPSSGPGLTMRSIPMAAEAAAEGFLSGVGNVAMGSPTQLVQRMLGGVPASKGDPNRFNVSRMLHRAGALGNFPPTNRSEEILAAGAGAAGGALPFTVLGGPAAALAMTGGTAAGTAAGEAAFPGSPTAQAIGGLVGGVGASGLANFLVRTFRAAVGVGGTPALQAMRAEGLTPRLASAGGGSAMMGRAEGAVGQTTGTNTITEAARKALADLDSVVERTASRVGSSTTTAQAGTALQRGGEHFIDASRRDGERYYAALGEHIPADDVVAMPNTVNALKGISTELAESPAVASLVIPGEFREMLGALGQTNNSLTWRGVRALRTDVGQKLDDALLVRDVSQKRLSSLYRGLSEDLRAHAASKGPDAQAAFERADRFWRVRIKAITTRLAPIMKKTTPEDAFKALKSSAPTAIMDVRRLMPVAAWDEVASLVMRRLGMAKPGAQDAAGSSFSASEFLTNWSNLTNEGRQAFFGGTRYAGSMASLTRVATMAEAAKRASRLANSSNTSGSMYFQNLITGSASGALATVGALSAGGTGAAIGATAGIGGTVVLPWVAAKLLTSPRFIKWLATDAGMLQIPKRLALLPAIVQAEPDLRDAMEEFVRAAGGQ